MSLARMPLLLAWRRLPLARFAQLVAISAMLFSAGPAYAQRPRADEITRNTTWDKSRVLARDVHIARNATLFISAGVEVRLAPGVAIFVDGSLVVFGTGSQRVRLLKAEAGRWEGIFGLPDSTLQLQYVDIEGAGAGGTVLASEAGSQLLLDNARIVAGGGQLRTINTRVIITNTEIVGNEAPYGAVIDLFYDSQQAPDKPSSRSVRLEFNRIDANQLSPGAPTVRITNRNASALVDFWIVGNYFKGDRGPELDLTSNGQLQGNILCNSFLGGTNGIALHSETAPPSLQLIVNVRANAIEQHQPAADNAILQRLGIGRGATSDLSLDMRENWWGNASGPYSPDRNAGGAGNAVGINVAFQPWLAARPACVP